MEFFEDFYINGQKIFQILCGYAKKPSEYKNYGSQTLLNSILEFSEGPNFEKISKKLICYTRYGYTIAYYIAFGVFLNFQIFWSESCSVGLIQD